MRAAPTRIQLSRKKGWKLPPNTVNVARPTMWGNPFRIGDYAKKGDPGNHRGPFQMLWCVTDAAHADERYTLIATNEDAVAWYRWFREANPPRHIDQLRGKDLACWCPLDQPCHADVLLELANAPTQDTPA